MIKKLFYTICLIIGLTTTAFAADQTFTWLPNSEASLAGYNIYCGTAYDTDGIESLYSTEISFIAKDTPAQLQTLQNFLDVKSKVNPDGSISILNSIGTLLFTVNLNGTLTMSLN